MSKLPRGFTNTDAVMITVYDFAAYGLLIFGLCLSVFTDNEQGSQWAFIAGLLFIAASNARMFKVLGRRTEMGRHPAGRDLNNGS